MKSAISSFSDNIKKNKDEGTVEKIIDSLVYVKGFKRVRIFEEVVFEDGSKGYIFSIDRDHSICLLTNQTQIKKGNSVLINDKSVKINQREGLRGKIINTFDI